MEWSNWSGRVRSEPAALVPVRDAEEVRAALRSAARSGRSLRCLGAGHSHSPLVATSGVLLDTSGLAGVVELDVERRQARIRGGTRIADLGVPLRRAGLALHNQGDIDRQALAGAVATGTHGTGRGLKNLSAAVVAATLVLDGGEQVECDAAREPELFELARLSLGAVGVVTELRVALRPAYRLAERMWLEPLDAVLERFDELAGATRHFEFFWRPGKARAACKALAETTDEPRYPLGPEGQRLAWSDEVLANDRQDLHSEMEYSVPAALGVPCLRALRERIERDFPDLAWPLEVRSLAADDVWISSARGRDTLTLSVHQGVEAPDEPLFRACEEIFRAHEGRPHWGKVHYQSGSELAALHERWHDWWRVRDRYDPRGRFLSDYLETLRP